MLILAICSSTQTVWMLWTITRTGTDKGTLRLLDWICLEAVAVKLYYKYLTINRSLQTHKINIFAKTETMGQTGMQTSTSLSIEPEGKFIHVQGHFYSTQTWGCKKQLRDLIDRKLLGWVTYCSLQKAMFPGRRLSVWDTFSVHEPALSCPVHCILDTSCCSLNPAHCIAW